MAEEPSAAPAELEIPVEKVAEAPASKKLSPKIAFEKLAHDFGEVPPGSKNTGEFRFTNTGQALLKITKVGKCCGVVAKLDKGKMEYAPGESGAVKVEWTSGFVPTIFRRKLIVHSNDPARPATTLNIQAKTVLRVTWEPTSLSLSLNEENAGCPKLTIHSLDGKPFSITGFKSTGNCITAKIDPSVKAITHVIEPKVDVNKLQKNLKGRIYLTMTHPEGKTATILFSVKAEYTVAPPLIMVFNAEPGKSITKNIAVLNNYGKDFEIESVSSKNNAVAFEVLEKTQISHGYRLKIQIIVPPADDGKMRFMDEFSINLKGGVKLPLKCNGYYPRNKTKPVTK